jgi:hypothetical protein
LTVVDRFVNLGDAIDPFLDVTNRDGVQTARTGLSKIRLRYGSGGRPEHRYRWCRAG